MYGDEIYLCNKASRELNAIALLIGRLVEVGVPYREAMLMPVPFALALLNQLRNGRQNNTLSSSSGKRKVATRRKSKE